MIYKFNTTTPTVPKMAPDCEAKTLHQKLEKCKELTREEKDRLAEVLYGLFSPHSSTYRLAGWAYSFAEFLPTILVKQYDTWQEYRAPDKTSLRKVLYGKIQRMICEAREAA